MALARSFIHDNYQEYTLGVSMVADELHITAAYLSTLFKVETGCNIVKYISNYRIEKAKELLETTNIRVGDVAEKVGYLNTSYFIALFRNNTGYSPAKYRERILLNE
ncbi:helix-turn-helix transcriptional regulator [Lachnospiraceae bacterium 54-11]